MSWTETFVDAEYIRHQEAGGGRAHFVEGLATLIAVAVEGDDRALVLQADFYVLHVAGPLTVAELGLEVLEEEGFRFSRRRWSAWQAVRRLRGDADASRRDGAIVVSARPGCCGEYKRRGGHEGANYHVPSFGQGTSQEAKR